MHEYFCIGFIDFMLQGRSLTDFTNFFPPRNFKKNDKVILNYFLHWDINLVETSTNRNLCFHKGMLCGLKKKKRKKGYFIAEICKTERMSKTFIKFIEAFRYFHKTSLVLLATVDICFICYCCWCTSFYYSSYIDCNFVKTNIIYEEDLNYYLEELSKNDLLCYHILKDLDGRFNDVLENTLKKIDLRARLYIRRSESK